MARLFILVCLACLADYAQADTYRCSPADGKSIYQEKPCASGMKSEKIEIKDVKLSNDPKADAANKAADLARLHEAFKAHLKKGDIDRARAVATTPEEFALVRAAEKRRQKAAEELAEKRAADCRDLATDIQQLRQTTAINPDNLAAKRQVNEAEERFVSQCQ